MATDSLVDDLLLFCRLFIVQTDQVSKRHGMTSQQWLLLDLIAEMEPSAGQMPVLSRLATLLQVSRANMTKLSKQLIEKKLVRSTLAKENDRRVLVFQLTKKGKDVRQKLQTDGQRIKATLYNKMGESELEAMRKQIQRAFIAFSE